MCPHTVLLVEDEPIVRQFATNSLEQNGFIVLSVSKAAEAIQVLDSGAAFDLLLIDVQMSSGLNGIELAERLVGKLAGKKILVISGIPKDETLAAERDLPFLAKPFTPASLVQRVNDVLIGIPTQKGTRPKTLGMVRLVVTHVRARLHRGCKHRAAVLL
jgi:CheY-like chemotaxis protein